VDGDLYIRPDLTIPIRELKIVVSRASGPGGQHVNKTSTRITVRWCVASSGALSIVQKEIVLQKLAGRLTIDGDLVVHNGASRSQQQNKQAALERLAQIICKALHVPKKRMKTRVPKSAQESRLQTKSQHSVVKKLRSKKPDLD